MAITQDSAASSPSHSTYSIDQPKPNSETSDYSTMNGEGSYEEINILAGDQTSHEPIQEELQSAIDNPKIIKLEMEDFVGFLNSRTEYQNLLPLVEKVLTCDERDWRRIRFSDTLEAQDFAKWQKWKFDLMRGYEESLPDHLLEFLTFEADILIHSQDDILPLLKTLPDDEDIVQLYFGGALQGLEASQIPQEIDKSLQSEEGVSIHLVCGWVDEEEEENTEWRDLCIKCKTAMEDAKATTGRSRQLPVRMPSRRQQRGVSREDVEDAVENNNPRRPPLRANTAPNVYDADDDGQEEAEGGESAANRTSDGGAVPRMPARGVRRGTLTREVPERAKSMGVLSGRTGNAADRLALLGQGSKRVSRMVPERSISGRMPPARSSSRKVSDGNERRLPERTNSRRGPPPRSTSRKITRAEEEEELGVEAS